MSFQKLAPISQTGANVGLIRIAQTQSIRD